MSATRKVPELGAIEFTGPDSITSYSQASRSLLRDLSFELAMGADEIYAALVNSAKGHPALFGIDVRIRARRVRNRLRRASEYTAAGAVECVAFHSQFRREFADVLRPEKPRRKTFDWGA